MQSQIKTAYIDIECICVDFCTEEERYIDPESHFIHIPRDIYHNWIELKSRQGKESLPLYVGIRNSVKTKEQLFFGRIEPSINSGNSNHTMALLPRWAFEKLGFTEIIGKIDMIYVGEPKIIDYIKVRGDKSSYVKFRDIKSMLENKLSSYNCLNINEKFHIEDVIFTVTEIKDKQNKNIPYGSLFDREVKIDFELPDDLIAQEKERNEKLERDKIFKREEHKQNIHFGSHVHTMNEEHNEEKPHYVPFQGEGLKIETVSNHKLTPDEVRELRIQTLMKKKDEESK